MALGTLAAGWLSDALGRDCAQAHPAWPGKVSRAGKVSVLNVFVLMVYENSNQSIRLGLNFDDIILLLS